MWKRNFSDEKRTFELVEGNNYTILETGDIIDIRWMSHMNLVDYSNKPILISELVEGSKLYNIKREMGWLVKMEEVTIKEITPSSLVLSNKDILSKELEVMKSVSFHAGVYKTTISDELLKDIQSSKDIQEFHRIIETLDTSKSYMTEDMKALLPTLIVIDEKTHA